jgi:glycogen(starch) synthase
VSGQGQAWTFARRSAIRADVRIALFCPSFGSVGGIETIATSLTHEFRRAGHHVAVLARTGVPLAASAGGIPVVRLPYHQLPRRSRHVARHLRFVAQLPAAMSGLRSAVRAARADVILALAVTSYAPYLVGLAGTCPLVVALQGGEARGQFTARPRVLRWALRRAARVVACAASLAAQARSLAPEIAPRLHVIPNGVDPARFADGPVFEHPHPYVVAVGRLVVQKGFDVLLEAFAALDATDVDLIIAGEGPARPALEAARDRLGLAARVHLLGETDPDRVAALYRGAVLVACPSRWEGLPLVCLEAMASGRPVVATAVDGIPDAVRDGETALLVSPEDPDALARALAALIGDPGRRARFGARGRVLVGERYAWPRVAGHYLTVLGEAAA